MTVKSEREARFLLLETSGRASLLAVLVLMVLTYGFLSLFNAQQARGDFTRVSASKACMASGCHNSPSGAGVGYIGVAVNGSARSLSYTANGLTAPAVSVAPGDNFQIDWIYANMQGGGTAGTYVDDNPLIAIPGTSAGGNLWTIAPGTADNPGTITLYDNTATTPLTMTYSWDSTHWNAADTVTSTTAIGGGTSNIQGWNTYMADTAFGTTGPGAINMTGYTIAYPTSGGGTYVWGSAKNLATDNATTNDRDGTKGRMGVDARITVPAGAATGTYNVYIYGIGHDTNNQSSKSFIRATIPVNVIPVISSTSPVSIPQGSPQQTLTINGSGFTNTSLSVAINDPNITVGTATYVSATQVTVPITVTSSATVGSKNITVTCSGVTSSAYTGFSVTAGLTATTTTVSAPPAIIYGQSTSFTATVSPSAATGTVQFKVDGVNQGSPVTVSGGTATLSSVTGLTAGNRSITAVYSGDATYAASTSTAVTQVVNKATPTLSVTNSPVTYDGTAKSATVTGSVPGTPGSILTGGAATQTNAGTYAVTADFTPTDTANYNSLISASAGNFVIDKANASASVTNSPVTYDGTAKAAAVFCAGGGTSSNIFTGGAASKTNAGTYAVTADCAASSNYNAGTGISAGNFTISKLTPTLSVTNSPVTYDGSAKSATVTGSVPGTPGNILTGGAASQTNAGTYAVTADFTPTDTANHNSLTSASAGNFVISKANASASVTNSPVTYDGTAKTAAVSCAGGGVSSNILTGGAASQTNAGTYAVTADCAASANYNGGTTLAAGDFVINKASQATVTVTAPSGAYYGQAGLSATASGGSGTGAFSYSSGSSTACSVNSSSGELTITGGSGTCSITAIRTADSNYNESEVSAAATVTISKADPNVTTWPTASSITYGQTLASSSLTGGSTTPAGAFAFTSPSTSPNAGTANQDVIFTPTDIANYNTASGSVSVTVNKASQTITFPSPTIGKTYGAADFSSIATTSSLLAVSYSSDNSAVATIDPVSGLVHIVAAGTASITANLAGDSNYDPASVQTVLTVDKAILTVSANDASRVYGAANPAFTPKYSGFVYGETAAVLSGSPDLSTSATVGSLAGSYPINAAPGTLSAANYSLAFGSGTLAIDIASQSISFNPLGSKTYGAAAFDLSATGGASGNPVTFESSDLSVATISGSTVTIVGAGTTNITAMQAGTTGAYASATAQQSLTIDKATLSVSAQSVSRSYGSANPSFTPLYSGFAYSDTAAVLSGAPDLSTSATISSPVGSYPITAAIGTLAAANYSFSFTPGTLGIDQAVQNISFDSLPVKSYGDTTFDLSATGGGSGNPVTFSSSNLAVATISGSTVTIVGAGTTDITASQAGNSNYTSASALQTLTVNKAALSVSSAAASRTYGAANPTLLPSYSGFVYSDTSAALQGAPALSTTADATSPVGSYPVTVGAGNLFSNNYSFSLSDGSLSVTKATITVTADNATRPYGAADPVFTASYSGFVNGETASVISGQPAITTTATISSPAGTYPINPTIGTLSATNYSFSMQPGTLTITSGATNANLSVTTAGSGVGTVNSSPSGIACSSGSATGCVASFTSGSQVTLTATADWKSLFTGWGAPCNGTGSCQITLNGDSGVTATFNVNGQASVLGHSLIEYGSLQDAYAAANSGSIIAAHVYTFYENLLLDRPIAVTLDMGKGDMYLSKSGYSTLQGSLTISQGSATVSNLIIR